MGAEAVEALEGAEAAVTVEAAEAAGSSPGGLLGGRGKLCSTGFPVEASSRPSSAACDDFPSALSERPETGFSASLEAGWSMTRATAPAPSGWAVMPPPPAPSRAPESRESRESRETRESREFFDASDAPDKPDSADLPDFPERVECIENREGLDGLGLERPDWSPCSTGALPSAVFADPAPAVGALGVNFSAVSGGAWATRGVHCTGAACGARITGVAGVSATGDAGAGCEAFVASAAFTSFAALAAFSTPGAPEAVAAAAPPTPPLARLSGKRSGSTWTGFGKTGSGERACFMEDRFRIGERARGLASGAAGCGAAGSPAGGWSSFPTLSSGARASPTRRGAGGGTGATADPNCVPADVPFARAPFRLPFCLFPGFSAAALLSADAPALPPSASSPPWPPGSPSRLAGRTEKPCSPDAAVSARASLRPRRSAA